MIERIDAMYGNLQVENRSPRPVVLSAAQVNRIDLAEGAGDLFIEDVVGSFITIRGQNVWAWQWNQEAGVDITTGEIRDVNPGHQNMQLAELPRAGAMNHGGNLFLFGMKTEKNRTKVWTTDGGRSEIYAYILANWSTNPLPLVINEDSATSIFVQENPSRKGPYQVKLRSACGDDLAELKHEDVAQTGSGYTLPLVTAVCPQIRSNPPQ